VEDSAAIKGKISMEEMCGMSKWKLRHFNYCSFQFQFGKKNFKKYIFKAPKGTEIIAESAKTS